MKSLTACMTSAGCSACGLRAARSMMCRRAFGGGGGQFAPVLGREDEVVPSCRDERRHGDLAERVHDCPAVEQVAASEDQRVRPHLRAPLSADQLAGNQRQAGAGVVGAADPDQDQRHLAGRELPVEPAPDQFHLLRAVAAAGEQAGRRCAGTGGCRRRCRRAPGATGCRGSAARTPAPRARRTSGRSPPTAGSRACAAARRRRWSGSRRSWMRRECPASARAAGQNAQVRVHQAQAGRDEDRLEAAHQADPGGRRPGLRRGHFRRHPRR